MLNGVLAPPLIAIVMLLTGRRDVMGEHTSPPLVRALGWVSVAVTAAAALVMLARFAGL